MAKTTTSLWYSVWMVLLIMALSILAVMMVNLPTPAHAKQIDHHELAITACFPGCADRKPRQCKSRAHCRPS
jgi:hypothetical protein